MIPKGFSVKGRVAFKESFDRFREVTAEVVKRYQAGEYRPTSVEELGRPWSRMDYQGREAQFLELVALTRLISDARAGL